MTDHEFNQAVADDKDGAAPTKPTTRDCVFFWIVVAILAATLAGCLLQSCQPVAAN